MDKTAKSTHPDSQELRKLRAQLRLSQEEMATAFGMDRGRYKNYEYKSPPPQDLLIRVRAMAASATLPRVSSLTPAPFGYIPTIGNATAGPGDAYIYQSDEDLLAVPVEFCRPEVCGVVLDASADSMLPYLHPGDSLIFAMSKTPRYNRINAVRFPEGAIQVKKIILTDGRPVLHSFNSQYPDEPADGHAVLGRLIGIISSDNAVKIGPFEPGIDEDYIENQLRSRLR